MMERWLATIVVVEYQYRALRGDVVTMITGAIYGSTVAVRLQLTRASSDVMPELRLLPLCP
jgi:hypothetical protein